MSSQLAADKAVIDELTRLCEDVRNESMAEAVFLLNHHGQMLTSVGNIEQVNEQGLGSLVAGTTAAAEGLAEVLGENAFRGQFHEGDERSLHIARLAEDLLVAILFSNHTNYGLVRLQVETARSEFKEIISDVRDAQSRSAGEAHPLDDVSSEDIDNLVDGGFE